MYYSHQSKYKMAEIREWLLSTHGRQHGFLPQLCLTGMNQAFCLYNWASTVCLHCEQIQLTTLICSLWGRTEYFGVFYTPFLRMSKQCSNTYICKNAFFFLFAAAHIAWRWHTCIETNVTHIWIARTLGVTYSNMLKMQSPETNILKSIFSCSKYKPVLLHPSELFSDLTASWHCWWNRLGCFQSVSISPVFSHSRRSLKEKTFFFFNYSLVSHTGVS